MHMTLSAGTECLLSWCYENRLCFRDEAFKRINCQLKRKSCYTCEISASVCLCFCCQDGKQPPVSPAGSCTAAWQTSSPPHTSPPRERRGCLTPAVISSWRWLLQRGGIQTPDAVHRWWDRWAPPILRATPTAFTTARQNWDGNKRLDSTDKQPASLREEQIKHHRSLW